MKLFLLAALVFSLNAYSNNVGIKVDSVEPGSTYAQWTLQKGDVIQKINNKELVSLNDLMTHMGTPSSVKSITVLRNKKEVEIKLSK
jgi:S1-C subfamily serine protease